MSGPARLGLFGLLLAGAFAASAWAGSVIGPSSSTVGPSHGDEQHAETGQPEQGGHGGDGAHGAEPQSESAPPGLAGAASGYRLVLAKERYRQARAPRRVSFTIEGEDGRPLREFQVEHTKRMHFIVVRRDLTRFQHLHPRMTAAGTWRIPVRLDAGGTYRVFADFKHEGAKRTLGADVHVSGRLVPRALPAPKARARTDGGLSVRLGGAPGRPGDATRVTFEVHDGNRDVTDDVDPYLGAKGHLVTLRAGDLAYLHTHPAADRLAFEVEYPSVGAYRMFLQFRYRGKVHTAEFTERVAP